MFQDLDDPRALPLATPEQRQQTVLRGAQLRRRRQTVRAAIPAGVLVLAVAVVAVVSTPILGTAPTPISPILPDEGSHPPFSAGTLITYQDGRGDRVRVIGADGSDRPTPGGVGGRPSWSPDGQRLAYYTLTSSMGNSIHVADADGLNGKQVASCAPNGCGAPAWSPDGNALVFPEMSMDSEGRTTGSRLVVANLDDGSQRVIATTASGRQCWRNPNWAPNGESVVLEILLFADDCGSSNYLGSVVAVVPTDGPASTTPTFLTKPALNAQYPDWHPTDDLIVFSTYDPLGSSDQSCFGQCGYSIDKPSNLYTIQSDGTDLRQITSIDAEAGRATMPTWTPDGGWVCFVKVDIAGPLQSNGEPTYTTDIAFVDRDGNHLSVLPRQGSTVRFPHVQPGG